MSTSGPFPSSPRRRSSGTIGSFLVLAAAVAAFGVPGPLELRAQAAGSPGASAGGARVSWSPDRPAQGTLFRISLEDSERRIRTVTGQSFGEMLHFRRQGEETVSALAAIPVDAPAGETGIDLRVRYADGGEESVRIRVPVVAGAFEHEELNVAPRYGSPPSEEDRQRRARDAARARGVSEASHRTPRLWTSDVILPRRDRVTSGFGNGRVFNGQVSSRHMGLDLDGERGDTVYAATRGVVELVEEFQLAGNIVYLNHGDGLVSGYFHLSEQLVTPGDTVQAGTPIGLVGATGRVTGPHLHWVVRHGYVSVDPRSLLEVLPGEGD